MTTIPDNPRGRLLMRANECVNVERNASYGDPNADFKRIAAFWNVYLYGTFDKALRERHDRPSSHPQVDATMRELIRPHDVALMIDLMKTSRLVWSPEHSDSWVDKAGYSACGWDVVVNTMNGGDDDLPPVAQEQAPIGKPIDSESVVWGLLSSTPDPDFARILNALGIPEPDSLHDILDRIGKLTALETYVAAATAEQALHHDEETTGEVVG